MPTYVGWTPVLRPKALVSVDEENPLPVTSAAVSSLQDSVLARPGDVATVSTNSVATASGVQIQFYTCPPNCIAYVPAMSIINLTGATPPTMQVRFTPSGATVGAISQDLLVAQTQLLKQVNMWLVAGDKIAWFVSTPQAASTVACYISVLQIPVF